MWGLLLLTATETICKAIAAGMRHLDLDGLVPWLRTYGSMGEGGIVGDRDSWRGGGK